MYKRQRLALESSASSASERSGRASALQALSRLTALDHINLDAHVGAAVDAIALCLEADDHDDAASAGALTPRTPGSGAGGGHFGAEPPAAADEQPTVIHGRKGRKRNNKKAAVATLGSLAGNKAGVNAIAARA